MDDLISRRRAQDELHKLGGAGAPSGTWANGWDKAIEAGISALQYVPVADRDTPKKVLYAVKRGALCPCCDTELDLTITFTLGRLFKRRKSFVFRWKNKRCRECGQMLDWGADNG